MTIKTCATCRRGALELTGGLCPTCFEASPEVQKLITEARTALATYKTAAMAKAPDAGVLATRYAFALNDLYAATDWSSDKVNRLILEEAAA